jgi:hypothetical protein
MHRYDLCGDLVRQCPKHQATPASRRTSTSGLAHPSDRLLIQVNADWRVIDEDLQYILQRRKGKARSKASGWSGQSYCRTRQALLRSIREYCGPVSEAALHLVMELPAWHVDR